MNATERISACDQYLNSRTGCYAYRQVRYQATADALFFAGLDNHHTLVDVGAGWTEFDIELRSRGWRGRYIPVDGGIDGTDLESWLPPRRADFFVALEVIEHMAVPARLVRRMCGYAQYAVVISTPNPHTTDVLGMDPTHKRAVYAADLQGWGFTVEPRSFYGKPNDSLFAAWTPR